MKYADETKSEYVNRIKRELGVGTVNIIIPLPSGEVSRALEGKQVDRHPSLREMSNVEEALERAWLSSPKRAAMFRGYGE